MLHRFTALLIAVSCLMLTDPSKIAAAKKAKLNVLFILADDLGWRDLSVEGSTFYESPNIDRIAKLGMRFTQGYAACQVCSPSRASIMTGKYPARHGITEYIGAPEGIAWKRNTRMLPPHYEHQLPGEDTTLAEAFREAGYRTFFAGKWHLGSEGSMPEDHGFEINIGGNRRGSPAGGFFSPYKNPKLSDGPAGESLPLRLGRETAKFIDNHADEPFLAYLSFYSVHAPIQSTKTRWDKYRARAAKLPVPKNRFLIDRTSPVRQLQDHPVYAGMIEAMDDAVGLALTALERNGLMDHTIIVFTSDNGGVSAGDGKATSNLPLRGGKGRQWEGGIREPYHIVWPGVVKPGSTCDTPVIGTDFYPTLLEMTGLGTRPKQHVDGVSLVPLLRGKTIAERPLYWHYPHYGNQGGEPSAIIRDGNWKLIHYYEDGRDELYDLSQDEGEQRDLASSNSKQTKTMRDRLFGWLKQTGAHMPTVNPNFNEQEYRQQEFHTRERTLPDLEAQAAAFLRLNYSPKGWWGAED
jgi:arylsulfatase A-like enzyme